MSSEIDRSINPTARRTWLVLTGRGILFLVLGMLLILHGAMRERTVELWVGSMLLAEITVASLYGLAITRGLTARIDFPRTAHARTRRVLPFHLVSKSGLPAPRFRILLQIEDALQMVADVDGGILGRGEVPLELEGSFQRRGRFLSAQLETRLDLMGVAEAFTCFEYVTEITVYPRVLTLSRDPVPAGSPRSIVGEAILDLPGQEVEVIGLREYVPGDSPRSVDWRAYARSGRLHVKERPRPSETDVTLAVMLPALAEDEDRGSREDVITIAASLAEHCDRRQQRSMLLLAAKSPVVISRGTGELHRARILTALTFSEPGKGRSLASLLLENRRQLSTSTRLVVLTPDLPDAGIMAELVALAHAGIDTRICTVGDPATAASSDPAEPMVFARVRRAALRRIHLDPRLEWSRLVGALA